MPTQTLTPEQEAQVAALDVNHEYGGLGYKDFWAMPQHVQHAFMARRGEHKAKSAAAVAAWVKALTDEQAMEVVRSFGRPFDSSNFSARVEDAANQAIGSRHASAPNTAKRLDKLIGPDLLRIKGDEAHQRWDSVHTCIYGFTVSQWVYFTPEAAADFDERQRVGVEAKNMRIARFRHVRQFITDQWGLTLDLRFQDNERAKTSTVELSLDDLEKLVNLALGQ